MAEDSFNSHTFADLIAKTCLSHYDSLPKTGKPQKGKEWTHMAAILKSESETIKNESNLEVISMATGSKCVGVSSLSEKGDVIHDSHAEVLSRRAFLRYLYHQLRLSLSSNSSSIFEYCSTSKLCRLKEGIHFHFFITHTPCGDASIFPKTSSQDDLEEEIPSKKQKLDDIFRTGAKCVPNGPQDEKLPGVNYHITEAIRTKPGRGERTSSVSCSDKITKWNLLGLQGALLSHFLSHPIYLTSIVIGKCPFNDHALKRALIDRIGQISNLPQNYKSNQPHIFQSNLQFPDGNTNDLPKKVPCGAAIIWSGVINHPHEVSVKGIRQGTTKKDSVSFKSSCQICKRKLFLEFTSILAEFIEKFPSNLKNLHHKTYHDCKLSSEIYQQANTKFRESFPSWPKKINQIRKIRDLNKI